MLSYTFSRREKILLAILAFILVFIAWFVLVFQNTNTEIVRLDAEIANVRTASEADQLKVAKMQQMQNDIARFEAEGARSVEIPAYDNLQPLMSELNGVLAAADTYSLSFADVEFDEASGYANRGVRIDFGCGSYGAARNVLNSLANGAYPCLIDSVSIADNSQRGSSRTNGGGSSSFTASAHMVFFEKL